MVASIEELSLMIEAPSEYSLKKPINNSIHQYNSLENRLRDSYTNIPNTRKLIFRLLSLNIDISLIFRQLPCNLMHLNAHSVVLSERGNILVQTGHIMCILSLYKEDRMSIMCQVCKGYNIFYPRKWSLLL